MAGPGNILITVGADTASAIRNLGGVNKALGDTMTTSEKMSAGLKKAFLPAAAALTAIGVAGLSAAKAAMADASSADHLANTMRRVTKATDASIASMEDYISQTALATGVADDKLRPAMEKLVTATGDQVKAQKLMNQVLDIAAATGKDVDQVSTAVAKAYQGQTSSLARLVPGLSEASRTSKDFTVIMDELADKTGGAAAKAAETAEGKMKRFSVATDELQESIGYALLPVINAVIPVMLKMATFAQENVTVIKILTGAVGAVAAIIVTANVAMKAYEAAQIAIRVATTAWTAAQWLLNAALTANPIGVVVVALAGLTAGIVLAYQRSETFRDIVRAALDVVRRVVNDLADAFAAVFAAAKSAFDWITSHWKVALFALGPVGAAIALIATYWSQITSAAQAAASAVVDAVETIAGAVRRMYDAIAAAVGGAIGWLRSLADAVASVTGGVRDLIGWLGRIKVPSLPGWLPDLPGPFEAPAASGRSRSASTRASSPAIVVNVYGALDPDGVARQIRRILADHDRRQGVLRPGLTPV